MSKSDTQFHAIPRSEKLPLAKGAKPTVGYHVKQIGRYFSAHVSALKTSFNNLAATPFTSLMTIFAIGFCLALPLTLYLVLQNLQSLSHHVETGAAVTLYVAPHSTEDKIQNIIKKAHTFPFVASVDYTPPAKALAEFQAASNLQDVLALLPENPLPGVIQIQARRADTTKKDLENMKATLSQAPEIMQSSLDFEWVEKLQGILALGQYFIHFLYIIIGIGLVFIVSNTIRLALAKHKEELEVLDLIGATQAYIRRPFLYRGMLYGIQGGVIAAIIVNIAIYAFQGPTAQLAQLFQGVFSLEYLTFFDTLTLLTMSTLLGWLGATVAYRQQALALSAH